MTWEEVGVLIVGVTGPNGFLAWHLRCAYFASKGHDVVGIGREEFRDPNRMDIALAKVDAVIHLAGVNRGSDAEVTDVNHRLATRLGEGVGRSNRPLATVFGNSIHSLSDTVFGRAKREASQILHDYCQRTDSAFTDVLLPNIFGEHGRPFYNSFVATFSHQLSQDRDPTIDIDRLVPLLHAQDAASILLEAVHEPTAVALKPPGDSRMVSAVMRQLSEMHRNYLEGHLPDLADTFTRNLFNTYRSFTFPDSWPIYPQIHADDRGELMEAVRSQGGQAQVFYSRTRPGFTRGEHFHLRKVERFLVLEGEALIRLRRLFTDQIVEFRVSGDRPAIVDMPTLWTHSITNIGQGDLLTLFFADDQYNPEDPDTYWVSV